MEFLIASLVFFSFFNPTYPFRDPSVLQHPGHLSHEDIFAMHAADGGFDQDDVSVPQYDLRSHAAPVHDAPSHAASIERRQQVDASNVIGDANAPQGQTRARTHQSPQLAAAAPPASATQVLPLLCSRAKIIGVRLSACIRPADRQSL